MSEATALWIVGGLVAAVAGLIQWWMRRIERDVKEGREGTERKIEEGLREMKQDVDGLGERFRRHEIEVARDYVSYTRLADSLAPLTASVNGLRGDVKELYGKVDGKADKPYGHNNGHD